MTMTGRSFPQDFQKPRISGEGSPLREGEGGFDTFTSHFLNFLSALDPVLFILVHNFVICPL